MSGEGRQAQEAELRKLYDAYGAGLYEATLHDIGRYGTRVADFLAGAVGRTGRVLDVGCGPGNLTRRLPEAVEVVGLDLSPDMVELARQLRPRGTWRVHSYHDPVPDDLGTFDAALAVGCLDYCRDLPGVFGHLARALREGGRALLTVCERRAGLAGHDEPRRLFKVRERTLEVFFYSFLETAQALQAAGLRPRHYEHAAGWENKSQRLTMYWGWWEVERARPA